MQPQPQDSRGYFMLPQGPEGAGYYKAALSIEGDMAKALFESIGPDLKNACGASAEMRVREKGDLDCVHDKGDRASPYVCHIGINLRTGKSMRGSIC